VEKGARRQTCVARSVWDSKTHEEPKEAMEVTSRRLGMPKFEKEVLGTPKGWVSAQNRKRQDRSPCTRAVIPLVPEILVFYAEALLEGRTTACKC